MMDQRGNELLDSMSARMDILKEIALDSGRILEEQGKIIDEAIGTVDGTNENLAKVDENMRPRGIKGYLVPASLGIISGALLGPIVGPVIGLGILTFFFVGPG